MTAHENDAYREIQNSSFMTLPDGKPLSVVGKKRGKYEMGRVTGPDFLEEVLKRTENTEMKHYFYGTTQENLNSFVSTMKDTYPNLKIVGVEPSVFRPLSLEEENELLERINGSGADFVWVALGAPRQEMFCNKLSGKTQALEKKSKVIANPITSSIPDPYDGEREKRIVAVNRLSQQKNIFMLLRAMKRVLDVFPEYILEIYGKGEQQAELEKFSKELKISDNVKFMGQKANVQTYIVNASVFVSSSDYEGMSNSMLEAMAIGLPVVCTDCPIGGARTVIKNNINGILTPVGDDKKFADAIIDLLSNPKKADKLGKNASLLREKLSAEIIAKKWEKLLKD